MKFDFNDCKSRKQSKWDFDYNKLHMQVDYPPQNSEKELSRKGKTAMQMICSKSTS